MRQLKHFKADANFIPQVSDSILKKLCSFHNESELCFYYKLTSMIYIRDPPSCFHKVCGKKLCSLSFNSNSSLLAERTFGKIKFLRVRARRDGRFMKGSSCADINVSPKIACNFPRLPSMRLTEI